MPDWKAVVQANLKDLRLGPSEQEEVAVELATHLEDVYEQFKAQGLREPEALRLTLGQASTWKQLSRNIARARSKEDGMNRRTRTFWVPGLVAFAAASIFLMILERLIMSRPALMASLERIAIFRPTLWWRDQVVVIYLCWWILLPLCGAAGAYLSRRAGGSRAACVASGLFPAIVVAFIFCFILPTSIAIEKNTFVIHHPLYFVLAMVIWVMVPALALILGALPFVRQAPRNN